ncbi:MAG TPA: hypothetical protein VFV99_20360 [Kofleriaceae bacterium]|nr:hypothetical protein [Kofleriaceae bacterium]
MRHSQLGVAALAVIGAILAVLGVLAIAMAPQIMNHAEIDTLRIIGGVAAGLGVVLLGVGMKKK